MVVDDIIEGLPIVEVSLINSIADLVSVTVNAIAVCVTVAFALNVTLTPATTLMIVAPAGIPVPVISAPTMRVFAPLVVNTVCPLVVAPVTVDIGL